LAAERSSIHARDHSLLGCYHFGFVDCVSKNRVRRAEFARLQQDAKELLELVKELQVAEQIRFLKEINVAMKDGEVPSTILSFPNTA
jgi:hypothetical protein